MQCDCHCILLKATWLDLTRTVQNTAYCNKFPYMWHQRVAIVVMNRAHRQFLHAGCRHNAFLMDSNNIFLPDQHSRDVSSCRAAGDFSSCELDYTMYVLSFARSENYVNHKYRVIWVLFTRWREIIRPLPSVNPSFFSQYHTYYYISISISTYIFFLYQSDWWIKIIIDTATVNVLST